MTKERIHENKSKIKRPLLYPLLLHPHPHRADLGSDERTPPPDPTRPLCHPSSRPRIHLLSTRSSPCPPLLSPLGLWPPHLFTLENDVFPILMPLPVPLPNPPELSPQITLAHPAMSISGGCPPALPSHPSTTLNRLGPLRPSPSHGLLCYPPLGEDLGSNHFGEEFGSLICPFRFPGSLHGP